MKTASKQLNTRIFILILGFVLLTSSVMALENIIPAGMREIAVQQGKNAYKSGTEADLSLFLNASLLAKPIAINLKKFKGIKGSIRAVIGGRNFSAADVDYAEIPFSTSKNASTNVFSKNLSTEFLISLTASSCVFPFLYDLSDVIPA